MVDVELTPKKNKGFSNQIKNAMSSLGFRSPTSHVEKKSKAEPEQEDKAMATVGLMKEALAASMEASLSVFGEVIGSSLDELKEKCDELDTKVQVNDTHIMKNTEDIDNLTKRIQDMEAQITTTSERVDVVQQTQQEHTQMPPASNSQRSHTPQGYQRSETNWGVIGNLGWDLGAEELLGRARQVLQLAKLEDSQWDMLSTLRTPGSTVSLRFSDPDTLEDASKRIRSINKSFMSDKYVWCSRQKSSEELKPNRILNKTFNATLEILKAKGSSAPVEKIMRGVKRLTVSGCVCATVTQKGLKWSAEASKHLSEEDMQEIAFVADE